MLNITVCLRISKSWPAEEGSQMDIAPGAVSRKIDDMSCIVIDLDVLPPEVAVEPTSPHSTCLLT